MMRLDAMKPNSKSRHRRKRVGRGESSGLGKTGGRGGKGQTARSGSGGRADFEGGQNPIHRRLPKFGFKSITKRMKPTALVNLGDLNSFASGSEVTPDLLRSEGYIPSHVKIVRVLAKGKLDHPLTIRAHHFSASALEKIAAVKGKAEVL